MYIEVSNTQPFMQKQIIDAGNFFSNILFHKKMADNIFLDVVFDKKLKTQGECSPTDFWKIKPREFEIIIRNKAGDDDPIKTLAHEMVHLKQYAKNELGRDYTVSKGNRNYKTSYWHGKPWIPNKKDHEYFSCPWEIEAYGMEVGLYWRWTQHIEKINLKEFRGAKRTI